MYLAWRLMQGTRACEERIASTHFVLCMPKKSPVKKTSHFQSNTAHPNRASRQPFSIQLHTYTVSAAQSHVAFNAAFPWVAVALPSPKKLEHANDL